ncbi:MAG: NAD(P)H-flavin reductase [Enterobacterales bacterium]|jgi:NAD(P)H-flavin reductase
MTEQLYDCTIIQCQKISSDIYRVILEAPVGKVFDYKAGQYLFINMAKDDARPYSIASALGDGRTLEMHIKDIPDNDFTAQVLQRLKTEKHISVKLPSGSCTIDKCSGTSPILFISGGTGFAHSHAIIKTLLASNDCRPIYLYWGANERDEIYLYDSLIKWAAEHDNFNFVPVINNPVSAWSGEKGMVHEAVFRNIHNLKDYDIYLSGSSAMVFNIYRQLKDKKVPGSRIFSDMLDIVRDKEE